MFMMLATYSDLKLSSSDLQYKIQKNYCIKFFYKILIESLLSIANKLLIYKAVIKPIWSYGTDLWGCASKSQRSHHAEIPIQNS